MRFEPLFAHDRAGISPAKLGLIEAHGTGTVAGDQTEAEALGLVLRETGAEPQACAVGSVKSMIGHTKCAAGLAGLIKSVFALEQKVLPPTLIDKPSPKCGFENARRKASLKRGGDRQREELPDSLVAAAEIADDLLELDEALTQLAQADHVAAELVKLRYFAGFTSAQAAEALGISPRTADRTWVYARSWLYKKLHGE